MSTESIGDKMAYPKNIANYNSQAAANLTANLLAMRSNSNQIMIPFELPQHQNPRNIPQVIPMSANKSRNTGLPAHLQYKTANPSLGQAVFKSSKSPD